MHNKPKIIFLYSYLLLSAQIYCMENIATLHTDKVAHVEYNNGISQDEHKFLTLRLPIVNAMLEKKLQCSIPENKTPKIAIVSSGGGYRAMLYLTGILDRMSQTGLLDTITYISALSGSTWALAPWITTSMSIKEFAPYIQQCASKKLIDLTHKEKESIAKTILSAMHKNHTLVDIYGHLLANRLLETLGDQKYTTHLSNQRTCINNGTYPFPLYSVIDGRDEKAALENPIIYVFNPYTINEHTYHTQIPSWADGRKFKDGKSVNTKKEKSLAYDLGTWGSAFAISIKELLQHVFSDHQEFLNYIEKILSDIEGERIIPCYAALPNYMYKNEKFKHTVTDKTLLTDKIMKRVDAGLENNLPYSPVSGICTERLPDITIFIDISAGEIGKEFEKVIQYAKKYNLPIPEINATDIGKKTISVFNDEKNPNVPTFIYMPRISDHQLWEKHKNDGEFKDYNLLNFDLDYATNHSFAKTEHFQYTHEHSTLVMNQARFNFHVNEAAILQVIKDKIDQKS